MESKSAISILFDLLEDYGVSTIVCSPGSRNASLLLEADVRAKMKKYVVTDERSAGFVALGNSLVARKPVALVCTSGTALLNYGPAIAEAYYQNVPLIVISADRPKEWIDQDDSQTMRQQNVFSNYSEYFADIDADNTGDDYLWYVNRCINEGLIAALSRKRGPVHFNVHISGTPILPTLSENKKRGIKFEMIRPEWKLSTDRMRGLVAACARKKVMIVAGFLPPDHKVQQAMTILSALPNVCVMAETISNLHLSHDCYMVDSCLFRMDEEQCGRLKPDIVISLGGSLVSRRLKEFLRKYQPEEHWVVGPYRNIADCFKALTSIIDMQPANFLPNFARRMERLQQIMEYDNIPEYNEEWLEMRLARDTYPVNYPWSDLYALSRVFSEMPDYVNLFLSNGTAVRYAQILDHQPPHATFSNRGVSGIEGSTSTAIGGMLAYPKPTCIVTGDLSFCYDLAALSGRLADGRMKIVVLNNKGGDIFRFIGATSSLHIREQYLCADTAPDLQKIAETFGYRYFKADDKNSLEDVIHEFFAEKTIPVLLEIDTRRSPNSSVLKSFLSGQL